MHSPTFGKTPMDRPFINAWVQVPGNLLTIVDDVVRSLEKCNRSEDVFNYFPDQRKAFWDRVFDDWDTQKPVKKPAEITKDEKRAPLEACGTLVRDLPLQGDQEAPPSRRKGATAYVVSILLNIGVGFGWADADGVPIDQKDIVWQPDLTLERALARSVKVHDAWYIKTTRDRNWDLALYWARNRLTWKLDCAMREGENKEEAEKKAQTFALTTGHDIPFKEPFDSLTPLKTCEENLAQLASVHNIIKSMNSGT